MSTRPLTSRGGCTRERLRVGCRVNRCGVSFRRLVVGLPLGYPSGRRSCDGWRKVPRGYAQGTERSLNAPLARMGPRMVARMGPHLRFSARTLARARWKTSSLEWGHTFVFPLERSLALAGRRRTSNGARPSFFTRTLERRSLERPLSECSEWLEWGHTFVFPLERSLALAGRRVERGHTFVFQR